MERVERQDGRRRIAHDEREQAVAPGIGRQVRIVTNQVERQDTRDGAQRMPRAQVEGHERGGGGSPGDEAGGTPRIQERATQPRVNGDRRQGQRQACAGEQRADHLPGRRVEDPHARPRLVDQDGAPPASERERREGGGGDRGEEGIRPRRRAQGREDRHDCRRDDHGQRPDRPVASYLLLLSALRPVTNIIDRSRSPYNERP